MSNTVKIKAKYLTQLSEKARIPSYERSRIKTGIVHIGVGNFHRAHQAYYTEELLNRGAADWGICGVGILEKDAKMGQVLAEQDGFYTLVIKHPEGPWKMQVIGSITEYIHAPRDPDSAIEKMADPDIKIISMTITEGGYYFDASDGNFMISNPEIQWDLHHKDQPKTVFGYLAQALKRRRERGLGGLTILSCDNIQHNGNICKKMLSAFVQSAEPGLLPWINAQVLFPNCMVDRITPVTTQIDIGQLKDQYGIDDQWPVMCEPFIQWVIEDKFINGRPEWERVGVQFVQEVDAYEKMKIRLLNAGHSLLGFSGSLCGYDTIDQTIRDPLIAALLRRFMDDEVTPVLGEIEGIDLQNYKNSLVHRFGNTNIRDQLSRICGQSSAKIPKFLLPTIHEQLEGKGPIDIGTFIVAAWCRYLELYGTPGFDHEVEDEMGAELIKTAKDSVDEDPQRFIRIKTIFGELTESRRFMEKYLEIINQLRQDNIKNVMRSLIQLPS